ncbi:MAG: hypothetical protein A3F16_00830 [Deltaproteobacteria bacterium RIFCSPHIGHO2_12_FULL_43_9]|nr:MAG: hypothetical protein A3F16_00830 [Deltaproteobacteria bacterium RIFCSPHIGHO2_12_FULL_43_9]
MKLVSLFIVLTAMLLSISAFGKTEIDCCSSTTDKVPLEGTGTGTGADVGTTVKACLADAETKLDLKHYACSKDQCPGQCGTGYTGKCTLEVSGIEDDSFSIHCSVNNDGSYSCTCTNHVKAFVGCYGCMLE